MTQPGLAVTLRRTPGSARAGAPLLGEHTSVVGGLLPSQRGAAGNGPAITRNVQPPLAGVRVLDLSILLAGPSCGRVLAEYGADVIKIDDPKAGRRSDSPRTRLMWLDVNRGKRSVLLDLSTDDGREVFWRLVETSDVIVENFRAGRWDAPSSRSVEPSKLEKLGVGYDDVRKRRPEIIYLSISAFGRYGEFTDRGGYEQAGQALTGIMVRHGGRSNRALALAYPYNDYGTGLVAAYGVLLALYERGVSGRGQQLDTSLAATAALLQSRYMFDVPGVKRNELDGPSLLGESWCSRLYRAGHGWFMLHGREPAAWAQLLTLHEFSTLAEHPGLATAEQRAQIDDTLASLLSETFAERTCVDWVSALRDTGLDAIGHESIASLARDETARAAGLVVGREHPGFGWVDHGGPVAHLSATPGVVGRPAPFDGADTDDMLASLGYTASEIEGLRARRGVA